MCYINNFYELKGKRQSTEEIQIINEPKKRQASTKINVNEISNIFLPIRLVKMGRKD